jgi:acyl carrier protein
MVNETVTVILEKIREILAERLGFDSREITGGSRLREDLGIDSFDSIRIIFEVEDAFDIKVSPTEVLGIKTVDDVVDYISARLK